MKSKQVLRFYNSIAGEYDRMISFGKRLDPETPLFRYLIEKYSIRDALDAGAGSGFHSILLARLGVNVTAVDISGEMLAKLKQNAKDQHVEIKTVRSDFLNLSLPSTSFDAIFCLGNSLVHIISAREMKKVISNFAKLLKPGGVAIIQLLNYDRIMKQKESIQSIKRADGMLFIRYYEFIEKLIRFNLLTVDTGNLKHQLNTVLIHPVMISDLESILKKSGFGRIELYGDLTLKPFSKNKSHDLVITARKNPKI